MRWLTSDTHFNHANIIRYCARPFANAHEMNEVLIARWNEVVRPEDTVYHLGDVAFGSVEQGQRIVERLHGSKVLVLGNHDRSAKQMREMGFGAVEKRLEIEGVLLVHNVEHATAGYSAVLCGHAHEKWRRKRGALNVGVDQHDFRPIEWDAAVREAMSASVV